MHTLMSTIHASMSWVMHKSNELNVVGLVPFKVTITSDIVPHVLLSGCGLKKQQPQLRPFSRLFQDEIELQRRILAYGGQQ